MTSEVAIMNRRCVVLAADSAQTVTYTINGKEEKRYFKGENKIIQLSEHRPVGLMTFGNANLERVPWELLIKLFRTELGKKSFNDIQGYANELFTFIDAHNDLFPAGDRQAALKRHISTAAYSILKQAMTSPGYTGAKEVREQAVAINDFVDTASAAYENNQLAPPFNQVEVAQVLATTSGDVANELKAVFPAEDPWGSINFQSLSIAAIKLLYREYERLLDDNSTGIVIAGYGDKDFFPKLSEYRCFGLLGARSLWKEARRQQAVTVERSAHLLGFASTRMIETIENGFSLSAFDIFVEASRKSLRGYSESIKNELKLSSLPNEDAHITQATELFRKASVSANLDRNYWPLLRVIEALPVDEMIELGETLIKLESLKEKVTEPTESVSGAVDVAVISKTDGFIWIKRKHYFDPQMNPRYFARLNRAAHGDVK
ncbi:MAG: hypothetical protein SFV19_11175 [Rhodospirillaceae bacterium]|nr:hypothetical protein [Rhodospirillaceae bacterium]